MDFFSEHFGQCLKHINNVNYITLTGFIKFLADNVHATDNIKFKKANVIKILKGFPDSVKEIAGVDYISLISV